MIVSFFSGAKDAAPKPLELDWPAFLALVRKRARTTDCTPSTCVGAKCKDKNASLAMTLASYAEGAGRGNAGVLAVTAIALDVDHAPAGTLEDTLAWLKTWGVGHLIYATHNHARGGADDECFRVVVRASRDMLPGEWPRVRASLLAASGIPADPTVKDVARLYYLPNWPAMAPRTWVDAFDGPGASIDTLLAAAPPEVETPAEVSPRDVPPRAPLEGSARDGIAEAAAAHLIRAHAARPDLGSYEAACILARDWDLDDDDALAILHAWSETWTEGQESATDDHFLERLERARKYGTSPVGRERMIYELTEEAKARETPTMTYVRVDRAELDDEPPLATLKGDAVDAAAFIGARHWSRDEGVSVLRHWRGDFYRWSRRAGCYEKYGDKMLERDLYQHGIDNSDEVSSTKRALVGVPSVLIDRTEIGEWIPPATGPDPIDVAVCRNGLLYLPTGEIRPASPGYFSTTCLGVAYDPAAPAPAAWLAFLDQLWPGDPESVATLQEWFGYALTPDTRQQKILLLIGRKRSGKGTVLKVLQALLGRDNYANPTLGALGTNFGLMPLIGKSAAIISDARLSGRTDTASVVERLLNISGEDAVTADRKNREHWTGHLRCKVTVVSNELPQLPDSSGAIASRFLTLHIDQTFYGREDTGLLARLLPELPGVLAWAIAGWHRLRERGHFVQPASSAGEVEALEDLGSPVAAWLRERCHPSRSAPLMQSVTCVEAYQDFRLWTTEQNTYAVPLKVFGRDLAAIGVPRGQSRRGDRVIGVYAGLTILPTR